MEIHIYHHFGFEGAHRLEKKLDALLVLTRDIRGKEEKVMKEVDDLETVVAQTEGVVASEAALLDGVLAFEKKILAEITAAQGDAARIAAANAKLASFNAAMAAKKQALLDAIPENAPEPPPAPPAPAA